MTRINKIWATILLSLTSFFLFAPAAFAQTAEASGASDSTGHLAIAIGFGLAFAAGMGALAQGKAAAAAFEGIARNPSAGGRLFTSLILSLALIESLVIYSLVISFMLLGKIG
jgi:F-type H+-transporting ATPase subunit c